MTGSGIKIRKHRGFTMIEMIIVIAIIMILASVAIPRYKVHIVRARGAVLREELYTMRSAIDQYTQDKAKAPQSLDDLVSTGYLRAIPKDPITNATDTWQPVTDDTIASPDQTETGMTDVHSGATGVGSDGTAYSTW